MKNKLIKSSAFLSGGLVSLCCGVPLVLALLGVAGIGFGKVIGEYHWYLMAGGIIMVSISWYYYFRERKKGCADGSCEIDTNSKQEKVTKSILMATTAFVVFFVALNVYSVIKDGSNQAMYTKAQGVVKEIKVSGMTCASCELRLESTLKKLNGVYAVRASVSKESVTIDFDNKKVALPDLYKAINSTGYQVVH